MTERPDTRRPQNVYNGCEHRRPHHEAHEGRRRRTTDNPTTQQQDLPEMHADARQTATTNDRATRQRDNRPDRVASFTFEAGCGAREVRHAADTAFMTRSGPQSTKLDRGVRRATQREDGQRRLFRNNHRPTGSTTGPTENHEGVPPGLAPGAVSSCPAGTRPGTNNEQLHNPATQQRSTRQPDRPLPPSPQGKRATDGNYATSGTQ